MRRAWTFFTIYGGRILAALSILAELCGGLWNALVMHQAIDLGSFGAGLAAIVGAAGILLAAPAAATAAAAHAKRKLIQAEGPHHD